MKRFVAAAFITLAWTMSAPLSSMVPSVAHADNCSPSISVGSLCFDSLASAVSYSDSVHGGVTITLGTGSYPGGVVISNSLAGLTIQGQGPGNTIIAGDGGTGSGTVIHAVCCNVLLSGLTVTGGTNSGIVNDVGNQGDAYPQSGLTLDNVAVQNNTSAGDGGGILNHGPDIGARLTLIHTSVTDNAAARNGGGIDNDGTSGYPLFGYVTMEQSTISDNCAGYAEDNTGACSSPTAVGGNGGGIFVLIGDLQIHDSTISGNTASKDGGGVWNDAAADGGAGQYWNEILTNMTVANNVAGGTGGGFYDSSVSTFDTVIFDNDTIGDNLAHTGGGLAVAAPQLGSGGPTELISTILAGNHVDSSGSGVDCSGDPRDYTDPINYFDQPKASRNIIGNESGCSFLEDASANPQDIIGTAGHPVDVQLGMIGSNGGGVDTMALGPGSPAIAEGDSIQCGLGPGSLVGDHDARLDPRNTAARGNICDAGAYDTGGSTTTVPGEPSVTAVAGDASATVTWSQPANDGGQKVDKFQVECLPGCGLQDVGPDTFSTTINGLKNHQRYVFLVAGISKAGIGAVGASNGVSPIDTWYVNADSGQDPSSGCAANSQATPYRTIAYVLVQCAVDGDIVHLEAAGRSYDGNLSVSRNVTIQGNSPTTSSIAGGTPVVTVPTGATVTLQDVTITSGGQGIDNEGNLTIQDSRITGDGGPGKAGAIKNDGGALTIESSTIEHDTGQWTGGIWSTGSAASLNILNSTIADNSYGSVADAASAIYVDGGSASLIGDTITRNHAELSGVAAVETNYDATDHWTVTSFSITNTIIDGNFGPGAMTGYDCSSPGPWFTGSYDLIGTTYCPGFTTQAQTTADHVITGEDASLGVLSDNGGVTQTTALGPGSPAIGGGDPSVCAAQLGGRDQRSAPRNPASCDIGAFDTSGGPTAPGAPQSVIATAGVESATLSWTAPDDGGSPVTGYAVTCSPDCSDATGLLAGASDAGTTIGGLTVGQHYTFTIYATNAVGAGEPVTTNSVTVKSPKPNAPTLMLDSASDTGSSNSDGITGDNTPTFKGVADPDVVVSVFSDGGSSAICTDQADDSGDWSCSPSTSLGDATHTITATANNGSGNSDPSATLTVTVDTETPTVIIDAASEPSAQTNATSAAFTFTTQDATDAVSSYVCTLDAAAAPCAGSTAAPVYPALADGAHTFTVEVTDLAGNVGSASYAWLVDTQAPSTVAMGNLTDTGTSYAFAPTSGLGPWTNDAAGVTVTLSATDENGGQQVSGVKTLEYAIAGAETTPLTSVSASSTAIKVTAEGASTVTYYAVDGAGNAGNAQTVTVDIDLTGPDLHPSVTPNPVIVKGQATAMADATDAASGVASQNCATPASAKVGSFSVTCMATDIAGNTATAKASYAVTYGIHTVLNTSVLGPEALAIQLQNSAGANLSARGTRVQALCVVPHATPAASSCGTSKALNGSFLFLPIDRGVYAYAVNTKGLVAGNQYDLLFQPSADPVVHAVTFTVRRGGLFGAHSVPHRSSRASVQLHEPRLRTGIWIVPNKNKVKGKGAA